LRETGACVGPGTCPGLVQTFAMHRRTFCAESADVRHSSISDPVHTATFADDCSPLAVTWFPKATVNFVGLR